MASAENLAACMRCRTYSAKSPGRVNLPIALLVAISHTDADERKMSSSRLAMSSIVLRLSLCRLQKVVQKDVGVQQKIHL